MKPTDHERIRALLDGELDADATLALRREAAADDGLAKELARQEALHGFLTALETPAVPISLQPDALLGAAAGPVDHERVRAYVDGELEGSALATFLADSHIQPALNDELQRQLSLRRTLSGLPTPKLPPGLQSAPNRAPWTVRLSLPAAAAAAALLFVAGAWAGLRHSSAPAAAPVAASSDLVPVRFVFMAGNAQNVSVAGSFNRWSATATPLQPAGDGIWEATVPLPRGEHRYIFQVDGRWQLDPLATQLVPDGMGNMDAVIEL